MVVSEILKLAVDSFRSSKLRFALTALGMVIAPHRYLGGHHRHDRQAVHSE